MGHTKTPFTAQFQRERKYFNQFRRALLLSDDQLLFEDLWNRAEFHIPAAEQGSHPLAIASILMAISLEQEKAIARLETALASRLMEIRALQARSDQIDRELENLRLEMKRGLQSAHAELIEARYPSDEY